MYQRKLDLERGARLSAALKGRVMISAGAKPYFAVKMKKGADRWIPCGRRWKP